MFSAEELVRLDLSVSIVVPEGFRLSPRRGSSLGKPQAVSSNKYKFNYTVACTGCRLPCILSPTKLNGDGEIRTWIQGKHRSFSICVTILNTELSEA